jgi:type I restriction enzyme S subunit
MVGATSNHSTPLRWLPANECLEEVSRGVGSGWKGLPLYGATREGRAPAKEAIGKHPERYKPVEPGTVFYNPMRILLGSIAMLDEGEVRGITSPDYVVVRGRPGVLHHRVFYYWLRSTPGEQLIRDLARGGVRERILFNRLCQGLIPVPPWRAQVELAEQLALVPLARRAALDRVAAAEALPAAFLRDLFESEQARTWKTVALGDAADIAAGLTLGRRTGLCSTRRVPYLRVANVKDAHLSLDDVYEIEATDAEIKDLRLRRGDLLLTEGGDRDKLGRGTFWQDELPLCLHQNHIFRVRLHDHYCHEFVSHQISSAYGKEYFLRHAKQTTGIATINQGVLKNFPLLSPPLADQRRIAADLTARLAATEAVVSHCREELAAIDAMPLVLLREAFGESTIGGKSTSSERAGDGEASE